MVGPPPPCSHLLFISTMILGNIENHQGHGIIKLIFGCEETTVFDVLTTINERVSEMFILGMFGMTLACGCGTPRGVSPFPVYHIFHVNVKQFT